MKKTYSFLLAAGIVLALAFILSCSDDKESGYLTCSEAELVFTSCTGQYSEDEDVDRCMIEGLCGGSSFEACVSHYDSKCPGGFGHSGGANNDVRPGDIVQSDVTQQPVGGVDSDVAINLYMTFYNEGESKDDSIPVGKIEGGLLTLDNLPDQSAIGEYLSPLGGGATYVRISALTAAVPGKNYCRIRTYLVKPEEEVRIQFWYLSKAVRPSADPGENFDLNFSQGWNFVYVRDDGYRTTDISIIGGGQLVWRLTDCEDENP